MGIASGSGGVGAAKAERGRRLSWLAAADLGALRRRRAPGGLVGPKVGTPVVPRMGPTRRLQPPGVALQQGSRPERPKRAFGARGPRRRNLLGLRLARSKRTPVIYGCSAPPSDGSSRRNPKRLRPARRPPTPKRSPFHRRQPAQTPPARTALAAPTPPGPEAISNPPPPTTKTPPIRTTLGANAPRPRSDRQSTAANQPNRQSEDEETR